MASAARTLRPTACWLLPLLLAACATTTAPRSSYRLGGDAPDGLEAELTAAYPEFFAIVMDPTDHREPDLRPLRAHLESDPTTPESFDALNAIAFAYFSLNHQAESDPGGTHYLTDSFRTAKIVAVPWRAYGEIEDGALRDAILDFFADASFGSHPKSEGTAPRLLRVVDSLRRKESDPARLARIESIVEGLAALSPAGAIP